MKKTIALLLAIMMLCTVLVGCGDNKTQNDNNDSPTKGYVLRLGTDAVGGTANTALEAMSAIVNQKTDMKTSTVVTTGAVEIAIGIATSAICDPALWRSSISSTAASWRAVMPALSISFRH